MRLGFVLVALAIAACDSSPSGGFSGETMGTTFSVSLVRVPDGMSRVGPTDAVNDELALVNRQMSTYDATSEISRFNTHDGTDWFAVSGDTASVVALALEIAKLSGGAFDPTIKPLVDLWGFGPGEAADLPPSQEALDSARAFVGHGKVEVRLDPPALKKADARVSIDLSAIAKGHGVDRSATLLEKHGYHHYFVEIGGEVLASGAPSDRNWMVGIERPQAGAERQLYGAFVLKDRAMATSGNYRNFVEIEGRTYGHSIDARTGWPVSHALRSVSVIAETCAAADGWATALMVLGPEDGIRRANENLIAALFLIDMGQGSLIEKTSKRWQEELAR